MEFVVGELSIPVYGDNGCCGMMVVVVVVRAEIWVQKINFENGRGVRAKRETKNPHHVTELQILPTISALSFADM